MRPLEVIPRERSVITTSSARTFDTANTPLPRLALLGENPFTTLISNAGGGFSRYGDIAINRWRIDATRDDYGQWCYLKNVRSGKVWSATHQPVCADSQSYRVLFDADSATFERRDGDFETRTEVIVTRGIPAEARRVTITNRSSDEAQIEVTSYQEVVLAPILSDRGHRAFGNLFVQTEWLPESRSILAMRRPRSAMHKPVWCGHTIAVEKITGAVSCETDRSIFIGRGRTARNPAAMDDPGDLSGTVGAVLDPVLSLRATLNIAAGQSAIAIFTTFYASDRDEAVKLAETFANAGDAANYFDVAPAGQKEATSVRPKPSDAALFQDLAGILLYGSTFPEKTTPIGGQIPSDRRDLIAVGLTGEWPILLATIASRESLSRIAEVISLHRYWRMKGVACDLVILCDDREQRSGLKDKIVSTLTSAAPSEKLEKAGGVFVLQMDALDSRQRNAIETTARIQIDCDRQTLAEAADV